MDYFILRQIQTINCCCSNVFIQDSDLYSSEPMILYSSITRDGIFADVLQKPYFSVVEEFYCLIEKYQPDIKSRPYVLRDLRARLNRLYYLLLPPVVECIHHTTKIDKQGYISQLVLDITKVRANKLFMVQHKIQRFYIIEQELVERAYEYGICTFHLEKLEVR